MLNEPRKHFAGLIKGSYSLEGLPGATVACTKLNMRETVRQLPVLLKYFALQAAALTLLIV
jgi:hypothetical protein